MEREREREKFRSFVVRHSAGESSLLIFRNFNRPYSTEGTTFAEIKELVRNSTEFVEI